MNVMSNDVIVLGQAIADEIADSVEPGTITDAFILTDGKIVTAADVVKQSNRVVKQIGEKALEDGSTQRDRDTIAQLRSANYVDTTSDIQNPPYSPEVLAALLQADEVHFRCCRTKVTDSVGRPWRVLRLDTSDGGEGIGGRAEQKEIIEAETKMVKRFLETCNRFEGFNGIIDQAAMDFESVGFCGLEVIRDRGFRIRRLCHVPAEKLRARAGWAGFVEVVGDGQKVHYQNFGDKVLAKNRMKDDGSGQNAPYDPVEDGKLVPGNVQWNLVDRKTGGPTTDWAKSANEILYLQKHHPGSIYYGLPDIMPAVGSLVGNMKIRDYLIQFFEHNTVPQFAVIIEGAKVGPEVTKLIQKYFSEEVKGEAHKTLVIPVPAIGGEVRVRFERLASETQEASFQDTKKNHNQAIMVAHGVSPAIIGIAEHSELGSGKGLSQAEIYKDRIVRPSQLRWGRAVNKLFRLGLGVLTVGIEFDPLDIRDEKEQMDVLTGYLKNGVMTLNEVRDRARLGAPIENDFANRHMLITGVGPVFLDAPEPLTETEETQSMERELAKLLYNGRDS